jgi:pentatricopeptide repeat protein
MHRSAAGVLLLRRLAPLRGAPSPSTQRGLAASAAPLPPRVLGLTRMAPLALRDTSSGMAVHEGGGCVSTASAAARELPRVKSRSLRRKGEFAGAQAVLDAARVGRSGSVADLVELLLVMLGAGRRADGSRGGRPRDVVSEMLDAVAESPAPRCPVICNILLTGCVQEAARMGENAAAKKEGLLMGAAREIWREMVEAAAAGRRWLGPERLTVVLMYRVAGECRSLEDLRAVRGDAERLGLQGNEDTIAAYLLCLGKCGRSGEADEMYYSGDCAPFRGSRVLLSALFQSHVASDRITKAEALIAQHGAGLLNVASCNAFVNRCATLRLRNKALDFVERMRSSPNFPDPNERTYNLLIKTLCASNGLEDARVAADRALVVVEEMADAGIAPTTVTYNTLVRQLADQGRLDEAMKLYHEMPHPDHLTFSHLMMGASKVGDIKLARRVKEDLDASARIYPNYSFCNKLLSVVARTEGVDAAFEEARRMAIQYGDALKMFGDVGGREAVRMALIHACGLAGDLPRAFEALRLELAGDTDDVGTLAPLYIATELMQVCLDCRSQGQALEVFYSIKRAGLVPNYEVYEKLIYGLVSLRSGAWLATLGGSRIDSALAAASNVDSYGDDDSYDELMEVDETLSSPDAFAYGDTLDDFDDEAGDRDMLSLEEANSEVREASHWQDGRIRGGSAPNAFDVALGLVREMHSQGRARSSRSACYVYNTLIAAAARLGNLDLAFQIFLKMCRHNNPGVIYYVPSGGSNALPVESTHAHDRLAHGRALGNLGVFDSGFHYPAAVPGTYNSMIQAARVCSRPDLSFYVYEAMQSDRINEPSQATLALLTNVSLEFSQRVGVHPIQRLLKRLDELTFISPTLRVQRSSLRKLLVALRWEVRK